MKNILLRLLAIALALFAGGALNMLLIIISPTLIPPPPGADLTTAEGLQASMHLMEPRHFIVPFLAHALGTLLSGFLAALLVKERKLSAAMMTGLVFLAGGIMNARMLPAPLWFNILDLGAAYLPMAWLGYRLQQRFASPRSRP
ncbi:MAG: hypothetical protein RI973_1350 [Bacteroidota bacterium]|jgi:hypothetical protein